MHLLFANNRLFFLFIIIIIITHSSYVPEGV